MSRSYDNLFETPGRLRGWLTRLAATADSPERTAAAFAIGVFLSFSPLLGFQIALGLGAAAVLRLNRLAVLIGLCTNMPWLMVPWYALTTATGAAILRVPLAGDLRARLGSLFDLPVYRAAFWERAVDLVWPFFWSFVLGSLAGALILGVAAYLGMVRFMLRVRAQRKE